jgi:hypothetical protein
MSDVLTFGEWNDDLNEGKKKKKGLWDNVHAKRKRGEKPAKPGDKDYPSKEAWKDATNEGDDNSPAYMFRQNLEQMCNQLQQLKELSPEELSDRLQGHDWAEDHIATSKDDVEEVFNFLMHGKAKSPSVMPGVRVSEGLDHHMTNNISLSECVYRHGSDEFLNLFREVRELYEKGKAFLYGVDKKLIEETDIGKQGLYMDRILVPLDLPMTEEMVMEAEYRGKNVELGKPKRGGSKAYYVYVKNPKTGNIKKVEFGSGMRAKINDPKAKKAYNARHGCSKGRHNDKTKAGYWSCRLPRYAKTLGLSGGGTWW